jgi:RND family efflux transporter MFP subunit
MTRKKQLVIMGTVIVGLVLAYTLLRHGKTEADDENSAAGANHLSAAAVVRIGRGTLGNSLTLSGAFKPFQEVDVHAKVAGYIKKIYVDVGTHVREGQTLAVLEVPELTAELSGADAAVRRAKDEIRRAQGEVERAKSAHMAAHAMYERMNQASEQRAGLMAQQEVDDAHAKDLETEAQVSSAEAALSSAEQTLEVAQANQKQYAALSNYAQITAPFAGVITTRNADTGALVAAGTSSSTQSVPLVRLAQVSRLRLVLEVPESLAAQIHLGEPVKVHVQALNEEIVGKVSRFAESLNMQTRTMETEIDFDNANEKLLPGMYAETVLQMAQRANVLVAPMESVRQRGEEASVLLVNAQNIVEERKVKLGLQGESRVEVVSGLEEGDRVIVGNQSQFRIGEKVAPKEIAGPEINGVR